MQSNYYEKYLKYKNKYITLKQQGGDVEKPKHILDKLVQDNCLIRHEITLDPKKYNDFKQFLNIVISRYRYGFLPENVFDDINFIGKTQCTDDDLKKIWYNLNKDGNNVKIDSPSIYKDGQPINSLIKYNRMQNESNNELFKRIFDDLKKLQYGYNNIPSHEFNLSQASGIANPYEPIHLNITSDELNTLISRYVSSGQNDISGQFGNYNYKLYIDKNILFVWMMHIDINLYILNVRQINNNQYDVFPYPYNNILLNDKYEEIIKYLFATIKDKLNQLTSSNKYKIEPDNFFHIHFTNINQKYMILTIHALYEITNPSNEIKYTYNNNEYKRIFNTRLSILC